MTPYSVMLRRIPVNPVIDDSFFIPVYVFCPRRDAVQALAILGVNYHLGK